MKSCRSLTLLLLAPLVLAGAVAQTTPAPPTLPALSPSAPASRAAAPRPASAPVKAAAKRITKPAWTEISPAQREVLAPLAGTWDSVSEAQKRKWLALSDNFPKLAPAEQAKLRSRMTEWVGMSAQQRSQARLNFGESQKLAPDDKRAKWEAYQALPPEEKTKLAGAAAAAKPPATAAAVKPVDPDKLAVVPKSGKPKPDVKTPRIAVAPNQVDHNTLLPQQPGPAGVPTN
ncbi:DUF3106 domain-containing protein [Caenimonas sp. SL110]|uniref:DUF3106 domain-containing protein n=1 Tax=Caenimonas sp. SL110 TaxID=1450524 RepID=UPI000653E547|nr:DUF3106 domain-containing protein [Caenimonas sp. SL110]